MKRTVRYAYDTTAYSYDVPHYYPYGEEITNGTANDTYKFAQTYRDSDSGLDYASQRFYASGIGRFLTGDSFDASASTSSPQSWNRYAYVQGDPVNSYDPSGLLLADVGTCGTWNDYIEGACDLTNWGYWGTVIGLGDGGGYANYRNPPTAQQSTQPQQCWQDITKVNQTLTTIGDNIDTIAANDGMSGAELQTLTSDVSAAISAEETAIDFPLLLGSPPTGPDYQGGHFNLILSTAGMSAALLGDLKKDFGGLPLDGKRQPAVDPKGWWLHSKGHDLKSPTAGYFNFHLDQYGGGTPGHIIHEVIGGNKGTPCLDPAWQRLGPR